jgi:D-sedoheptulose 7-phosphate isomerase
MLPVAILAGGLATRLRPVTEKIPKALVEINGEPFLAHQLRLLASSGIRRVTLCVGYLAGMIEDYAGDGRRFGLELTYSPDGPRLRGTAGAIAQARPLLGESFFVLYGDSYLPCDYRAVCQAFENSGQPALMTVYGNRDQWDASNVHFAGGRILAYSKKLRTPEMRHIDYGLGVFHAAAFDGIPEDGAHDLADLYQVLLARGELAGFEVSQRFWETGSFTGIRELSAYLAEKGGNTMSFSQQFLSEAKDIIDRLDLDQIERMAALLAETRARGGRLFILGVGGSAANASHAVNDFRKIAGMEAYSPTDNVSELTARTNDEGWATVFESWLRGSRLRREDTVLVFSVGGGNLEKNVSPNLVQALQYAKTTGSTILGIVGRDGGFTAQVADACVIVPTVNTVHTTPHAEAFQAVVWHLLVSHPQVKQAETKWESVR